MDFTRTCMAHHTVQNEHSVDVADIKNFEELLHDNMSTIKDVPTF